MRDSRPLREGDTVVLREAIKTPTNSFDRGHEFTISVRTPRGFDLIDPWGQQARDVFPHKVSPKEF